MNLWIGTSGFQYAEWKGSFYPEDLPASKMLPFYAERFSTTEINYTFHRIPSAKTIENWNTLTPESFRFALKAPQKIRIGRSCAIARIGSNLFAKPFLGLAPE